MSTLEKNLYDRIAIKPTQKQKPVVTSKAYRGLSTVNPENTSSTLYDLALIKQDLLNHLSHKVKNYIILNLVLLFGTHCLNVYRWTKRSDSG